jgi:hypothetical protein
MMRSVEDCGECEETLDFIPCDGKEEGEEVKRE